MFVSDEVEDVPVEQGLAAKARTLVGEMVGKASTEADELARQAGVILRILKSNEATTLDYVEHRITAIINDAGEIVEAKVG